MLRDRSTTLPNGLRVRLRLPLPSDHARLRRFHAELGLPVDDMSTARLIRYDPRERSVLCATAFGGNDEVLVGFGAIERGADAPYVLLAHEERAPGVRDMLAGALRDHARRRVA